MANLGFDFTPDVRPLAARMRPTKLTDYLGQRHLIGEGCALRQAILVGQLHSMILWGPPGTGKTTLAEIIASHANAQLLRLSAVTAGVKEIREAVQQAKMVLPQGQRSLLFVDEVHRFNKSQQDALLPHIEDGTFVFIGATTENPSFALNNAILSRARVYVLQPLTADDVQQVLHQALTQDAELLASPVPVADDLCSAIANVAGGDARLALNLLEIVWQSAQAAMVPADLALLKQIAPQKIAQFDNGGDLFYDLLSAFHKSMRGSDGDAALYWFCRLLAAGGEPLVIARRLLAIASEDIGNADPKALTIALNAWDIYQRVGPAEGERALAQAILYMAAAPKSNAVYQAFNAAKQLAAATVDLPVPTHIRNAPTALLKELGHGATYRYSHDEPHAVSAGQTYLPEALLGTVFYRPTERGLEAKIAQKLAFLAQLNQSAQE